MNVRHSGPRWPCGIEARPPRLPGRGGARSDAVDPRAGAILAVVLILVVVFSTLGLGLLRLSSSIAVETSGAIQRSQAFWAAEAGLQEARALAGQARDEGSEEVFPFAAWSWSGTNATCVYEVDTQRTGEPGEPPRFRVECLAQTPGGVACRVGMSVRQIHALPMPLFAAERLKVHHGVSIAAYDSSDALTSTHGARIGSIGIVDLHPAVNLVDLGAVALGTDPYSGTAAQLTCEDCGFQTLNVGDTDPDPLGIFPPGPLATLFEAPAIWTSLSVQSGTTNTLSSGATHYLNSVSVQAGGVLDVDVTNGVVNVFLTGPFQTAETGQVRVSGGPPSRFRIYANGTSSTVQIRFAGGSSGAFIYAPGSSVVVDTEPGTAFRGGVWGRDVDIRVNTGDWVFLDDRLLAYDPFSNSLPAAFGSLHLYRLAYSDWVRTLESPP